MLFNLTKPCSNCPFRNDKPIYLTIGRIKEIYNGLTKKDQSFSCHKTVDYSDFEEIENYKRKNTESFCAGALIFLKNNNRLYDNKLIRVSAIFKLFDDSKLDLDSPIYKNYNEMINAFKSRR